MAGSTVNDIAHHIGCSRQIIHYFMNRYNKTGYVRVCARTGHARVTTLRAYRVNSPTLFKTATIIARLYGVHVQKIISHFVQNNGPSIFQHDNARPHTIRK